MTTRYVTRDNDTVDLICWRHYGVSSGAVELVLEANPGLASLGAVLSAGTVIILPTMPEAVPVDTTVRLWD